LPRYTLLFLIALLWQGSLFAQKRITTSLVNEAGMAVPYAVFSIYEVNGNDIITSTMSDSLGVIDLETGERDSIRYTIAVFGYNDHDGVLPLNNNRNIFPPIVLKANAASIENVTISLQRPLIERKIDRTVFNVANSVAAIGSDAFDLLKKTPGVKVSQGIISIIGKSTVSVMLNDKLMQLDADELEALLRGIPSNNIAKIEVITMPPAKYDAAGNAGIINIITRKTTANGINGSLSGEYERRAKSSGNLSGNFNYRQGKWNVYGNTHLNKLRFVSRQVTNTLYPTQQQYQVLNQDNRPAYSFSQAGIDYNLNPDAVLGLIYSFGTLDAKRDENYGTSVVGLPSGRQDSVMNTIADAGNKGRRHVFNLNYDWKIDTTGKRLSVNADYLVRHGNNRRDFINANFLPDGMTTEAVSDNKTSGAQLTDIRTARADFEWPLKMIDLSAGAKVSFIHNNSDNVFTVLQNGYYVTDTGKTNEFDYKENTQALYISASKKWHHWNWQLGLRGEYTQTKGISVTQQQITTNRYFKLFPTAYLQYLPDETHSLNFNYSRRIERPSFWIMNPFRAYRTEASYDEGNPFLQPSFTNNLELGYAYKSFITITLFAGKADNVFTRVSRIDTGKNFFIFTQANAGRNLQSGLTTTLNFRPLVWWECSANASLLHSTFSSTYYEASVSYNKTYVTIASNSIFTLNKNIIAEIGLSYTSSSQEDFNVLSPTCNVYSGIKWLLPKRNLVIALNANDIFRTDRLKARNLYNGTYQNAYYDARSIGVSVLWKFGNKEVKEKRQRKTDTADTKRAG